MLTNVCSTLFWLRASGETLVMLNHKRDPIFDAFAIPEVEYVSSGISKGEGPEEVANVMPLSLERSTRPGQFTFLTGVPSEIVTIQTPDFKIIDKSRHRMPEGWPGEQNMLIIKGDTVLAQRFSEPLDWIIAEGRVISYRYSISRFPTILRLWQAMMCGQIW